MNTTWRFTSKAALIAVSLPMDTRRLATGSGVDPLPSRFIPSAIPSTYHIKVRHCFAFAYARRHQRSRELIPSDLPQYISQLLDYRSVHSNRKSHRLYRLTAANLANRCQRQSSQTTNTWAASSRPLPPGPVNRAGSILVRNEKGKHLR